MNNYKIRKKLEITQEIQIMEKERNETKRHEKERKGNEIKSKWRETNRR
jgi:hypothetical protein